MTIRIPANDFGHIRIFKAPEMLSQDALDKTPEGLAELFGTTTLDPTYIDIVSIVDLSSMSLADYIKQGYDVEIAEYDIQAVNGIEGYAILILSSASDGKIVTLRPNPDVHHVTTYVPTAQLQVIAPLNSDAASGTFDGTAAKPTKSDARIGGMVATVALIVMFLLVAVMVWVA